MNTKDLKEIPDELKLKALNFLLNANFYCEKDCQDGYIIKNLLKETIPPKPKVVDMSVFIGSGIDCEFWHHGSKIKTMGQLKNITKQLCGDQNVYEDSSPATTGIGHALYCRPRMNYWFSSENFNNIEYTVAKIREAGFVVWVNSINTSIGGFMAHAFMIEGLKEGYILPGGEE